MSVKFRYRAKNKEGKYFDGEMEADAQNQVLDKLEAQGLWVVQLAQLTASEQGASAPTPTFKSEHVPPSAAAPTNTFLNLIQDIFNKIVKNIAVVITVICLLMLPLIFKINGDGARSSGPLSFKIITTQDYSENPDYLRFGYLVEIPSGMNSGDVRRIAETLQAEKMKADPQIQEVMFRFFYTGQNPEEVKPVAVLQWNWNQSKDWESSFDLSSAPAEGGIMEVKQKQVDSGESVTFDFIVANNLTIPGAQTAANQKAQELKKKWLEVKEIKVNVIYDGFDDPFLECSLDVSRDSWNCDVLK